MGLRDLLRPRARTWPRLRAQLASAQALEVGGPSRLFTRKGRLPVYTVLAAVDRLDFAGETLWGDAARRPPGLPPGRRLEGEAATLEGVADGVYDAWLASHVLEHCADPLRVRETARRVLAPPGHAVLVLPHPVATFDHRRPVTTLEHLRDDRRRGVGEDDRTHFEEVLALHDLDRDPGVADREAFARRVDANLHFRAVHHHVFDPDLAVRMLDEAGFAVDAVEVVRPYHLVLLARADGRGRETNARHLEAGAPWRRWSPFDADRRA